MPINFRCQRCQTSLTVPNAFGGKRGKCPKCAQSVLAPAIEIATGELSWVPAVDFDRQALDIPKLKRRPTTTEAATPTRKLRNDGVVDLPEAEEAPSAEAIEAIEAPVSEARLVVVSEGRNKGKVFPLGDQRCAVIGRDSRNAVTIPSSAVSRHHCQVEREEEGFVITDLGSSNGTIVNGNHTISQKLADGDYIQIGDTLLKLELN